MPTPESNKHPQTKNPLQGVTLEALLTELHAQYGWEGLAQKGSYQLLQAGSQHQVQFEVSAQDAVGQRESRSPLHPIETR
jgi:hypothetical protein